MGNSAYSREVESSSSSNKSSQFWRIDHSIRKEVKDIMLLGGKMADPEPETESALPFGHSIPEKKRNLRAFHINREQQAGLTLD